MRFVEVSCHRKAGLVKKYYTDKEYNIFVSLLVRTKNMITFCF